VFFFHTKITDIVTADIKTGLPKLNIFCGSGG
jgi:hypothetical protein